ncbi:MAG: hypothetical protein HYR91_08650 [Flavobacteriia bacterium]|nr:hypothetical protein [Flavobacteriia bacterium]
MFKRYFLYSLSLISLVWICFVGYDIINKENQFSPSNIFGLNDGKILIINKLNENPIKNIEFNTTKQNEEILTSIIPWLNKNDQIIYSSKQTKIYIDIKENWTKSNLIKLFKNAKLPIEFDKFKSFHFKNVTGKYNQSILVLTTHKLNKIKEKLDWEIYDKNASASIITFYKNTFSIDDIYFKTNNKIEYISLKQYHFTEDLWYAKLDKIYKNGPLHTWAQNGFVEFEYNQEKAIISDYKDGQNPILILNEIIKSDDNNEEDGFFEKIQLTKNFPTNNSKGFYAKIMDDFIVISETKDICEQIIADYRIGNTIAMKKKKINYFYANLPRKVSERFVSETEKFSKTCYKDKLFETHLKSEKDTNTDESEKLSFSTPVGIDIENIIVLNEIGNIIILNKNGFIKGFKNSKRSWEKEIKGYPFHEVSTINLDNNQKYLITSTKEVHLIDKNGKEENGFPIQLQSEATNNVTYFTHKGIKCLAIANDKNEINIYNFKGKLINIIKTSLSLIKHPLKIWTSKKITLIGAKDDFNYCMYNLEKKKEYRKFNIPKNTYSIINNNELVNYSFENNDFIQIDQKGNKSVIKTMVGGKILKISHELNEPTIIIQASNEVICFNSEHKIIARTKFNFGQLEFISLFKDDYGQIITTVIDGISNNVYAYSNNEKINLKNIDGKNIAYLNYINAQKIITTIVDEYVIQYVLN